MILLLRSVMIFVNTDYEISKIIKKKARNPGKSQLFAENFAQNIQMIDSFNKVTRYF